MKEQSRGDNRIQFIDVNSEEERNVLRQLAAMHALGRNLTQDELDALRVWRDQEPELAVVEIPKLNVTFNFKYHFGCLSVTEIYTGNTEDENLHPLSASIGLKLYRNSAILWLG